MRFLTDCDNIFGVNTWSVRTTLDPLLPHWTVPLFIFIYIFIFIFIFILFIYWPGTGRVGPVPLRGEERGEQEYRGQETRLRLSHQVPYSPMLEIRSLGKLWSCLLACVLAWVLACVWVRACVLAWGACLSVRACVSACVIANLRVFVRACVKDWL